MRVAPLTLQDIQYVDSNVEYYIAKARKLKDDVKDSMGRRWSALRQKQSNQMLKLYRPLDVYEVH